jgi:nucleoside-diphosphate-sugar epimerase
MHKLKMFRAIRDGKFPLLGGGRSLLHPTYTDDVVRGMMAVLDNPDAHGERFNIAGPEPLSVKHLVGLISTSLGTTNPPMRVPTPAARAAALGAEAIALVLRREPAFTRYQVNFFTRDHASDISKAHQVLGYVPQVSVEEGIAHTIDWYKREGHL